MKRTVLFGTLALLGALVAPPAGAQGGGPAARGTGAARLYDPKTVETVSGEVVSVERARRGGGGGGLHVTLKTDGGQVNVRLGPGRYLDRQGMRIEAKDRLQVRGSRVTVDGQPAIIAAEVTKGSQTVVLRDESGAPKWRGRGGRKRAATPPAP